MSRRVVWTQGASIKILNYKMKSPVNTPRFIDDIILDKIHAVHDFKKLSLVYCLEF